MLTHSATFNPLLVLWDLVRTLVQSRFQTHYLKKIDISFSSLVSGYILPSELFMDLMRNKKELYSVRVELKNEFVSFEI